MLPVRNNAAETARVEVAYFFPELNVFPGR
jgi:hypothetical protein